MSGFSGIESVPGPQLPQIDFLNRFNGLISIFLYVLLHQTRKSNSMTDSVNPGSKPILQKKIRRNMLSMMKDLKLLPC